MQLTRAADYAVRVMIHLAAQPPGTRLNRAALASAAEVPEHFLSKVLQALGRARLIAAQRGTSGGFALAAAPEDISVLRVVEAIEGPLQLNVCLTGVGCHRQGWCPAHMVWVEAQAALTQVLKNASIAKLARESVTPQDGKVIYPWN
ncbi:MAG: Rrf2 family transcriptional regulator [Bryobacteraceae bacterium]